MNLISILSNVYNIELKLAKNNHVENFYEKWRLFEQLLKKFNEL
jgi:hypothetical protein